MLDVVITVNWYVERLWGQNVICMNFQITMKSIYLLPIRKSHKFAQAQIYDLMSNIDYQLLVDPKIPQNILSNNAQISRNVIVYIKNERTFQTDFFDNFVKVEVEKECNLVAILAAVKALFSNSQIFVVLSIRKTQLKKKLRKEYVLLDEDECFN